MTDSLARQQSATRYSVQ